MKTHPAFRTVLAAAKRAAKSELNRNRRERLRAAIKTLELFRNDNHDFIEFYNDDAEL